jgi:hypothetical protein
MRTLLKRVSSGLYYQGPDRWTTNPADALDFKMIDRALKFIEKWNLQGVELAFAFKDRQSVLQVSPEKLGLHYSES